MVERGLCTTRGKGNLMRDSKGKCGGDIRSHNNERERERASWSEVGDDCEEGISVESGSTGTGQEEEEEDPTTLASWERGMRRKEGPHESHDCLPACQLWHHSHTHSLTPFNASQHHFSLRPLWGCCCILSFINLPPPLSTPSL